MVKLKRLMIYLRKIIQLDMYLFLFSGSNGAVRYRIRKDPVGNYKTFKIDPVSGLITLALGLDRERQKVNMIFFYLKPLHVEDYYFDIKPNSFL